MAGRFTRRIYDGCAFQQDVRQSTEPLDFQLDVTKFVNCNNMCKPQASYSPNSAALVDVESSLWGLDKISSKCDQAKHPFCSEMGCLLTKDPRVPLNMNPLACDRGKACEPYSAVIKTNMCESMSSGIPRQTQAICPSAQQNGYYAKSAGYYTKGYPQTYSRQQGMMAPMGQRQMMAPTRQRQMMQSMGQESMAQESMGQESMMRPMVAPMRNQQMRQVVPNEAVRQSQY